MRKEDQVAESAPERSGGTQAGGGSGRLGTPEEVAGRGRSGAPAPRPPRRVEKPWGYESIWAETDEYVGKLLFVKAGEALSLQFHEEKDETLFLLSGEIRLELGAGVHSLEPVRLAEGQTIRIRPGLLHRMEAVTDATILEASTAHLDDVVRVSDRYGRAGDDEESAGDDGGPAREEPEEPGGGSSG